MIGAIIRFIFGENAWPEKREHSQSLQSPKIKSTQSTVDSTPKWQESAAKAGALINPSEKPKQEQIKTVTIDLTPSSEASFDPRESSYPDFDELLRKGSFEKAANAKKKALAAEKKGDFDQAWRLFHEQKAHYLEHASDAKFSPEDVLSLDAGVSENFANILRKQKKHNEAFVHITYWVLAQRDRPLKKHADKFRAYYNRADKMNVSLDDAWAIAMTTPSLIDYKKAQLLVNQWLKPDSAEN